MPAEAAVALADALPAEERERAPLVFLVLLGLLGARRGMLMLAVPNSSENKPDKRTKRAFSKPRREKEATHNTL